MVTLMMILAVVVAVAAKTVNMNGNLGMGK